MYLDETKAIENIPTLKMLTYKIEELEVKANKLFEKITALNLNASINIEDGFSQVGGGSMPLETISTKVIAITPEHMNVSSLEKN